MHARLLAVFLLMASAAAAEDCGPAIEAAERAEALPPGLLRAIGRVESGRRTAMGVEPWPWALNAGGAGFLLESREEALARLRQLQAAGHRSIDIGCLQVNLQHHPQAFPTPEDGFSPALNAAYAARFLRRLQAETGDWMQAVARYHSGDPQRGAAYRARVAAWLGTLPPATPPALAATARPLAVQRPGQAAAVVVWLQAPPRLPRLVRP
ncbi:lytic transglycosylase domain-containing protein [Roseomonas sp. USHLN139]|uniref:lytic transglycosylase domain-containing protein n=1 Tax=Roseomonas sp. USHLN139 TaxID=3081298 RepID=UPI003B0151DE